MAAIKFQRQIGTNPPTLVIIQDASAKAFLDGLLAVDLAATYPQQALWSARVSRTDDDPGSILGFAYLVSNTALQRLRAGRY